MYKKILVLVCSVFLLSMSFTVSSVPLKNGMKQEKLDLTANVEVVQKNDNIVVYHFTEYYDVGAGAGWQNEPEYMVDGIVGTCARTSDRSGDEEYLIENSCNGEDLGNIESVYVRAYGWCQNVGNSWMRIVFGSNSYDISNEVAVMCYSEWKDITNAVDTPETWTWDDIVDLDIRMDGGKRYASSGTAWCGQVEIKVVYQETPPPIPGDINGDGCVNAVDLGLFAGAWMSTPGDDNWNPDCDFNGDGRVNFLDLQILRNHWLEGCE